MRRIWDIVVDLHTTDAIGLLIAALGESVLLIVVACSIAALIRFA